jgi:hypothetical protein
LVIEKRLFDYISLEKAESVLNKKLISAEKS